MTTTSRKLKLSGVMAEYARNKAAPGLILPTVKDHMLKHFGPDLDRDPTVIHPSELAKADWCPLAAYRRIVSATWPPEAFDFVRENIFGAGNDIHAKWQGRLIDAGLPVWGDWRCIVCKLVVRNCHKPAEEELHCYGTMTGEHMWEYAEVTLDARAELLIAGHADAGVTGDDYLVEIKSIGLGSIRMDAPGLLSDFQDGRMTDLTGLWKAITRPLKSHLIQGDVYLHLAHVLGLPFTQIVYLYEFKPNQLCKEFTIKYSPERSGPLIAKAEMVKYHVEQDIPPACIKGTGCKQCNAIPAKPRRTVASTRSGHS